MAEKQLRRARVTGGQRQRRPRRGGTAWRELIRQQGRSGLSVRAFCEVHDLSEPRFYAWRRRLRDEASAEAESASFVRLEPTEPASASGGLVEVAFADGVTLRCGAERLEQVVRLLRERKGGAPC